jgi:hypothetical protein
VQKAADLKWGRKSHSLLTPSDYFPPQSLSLHFFISIDCSATVMIAARLNAAAFQPARRISISTSRHLEIFSRCFAEKNTSRQLREKEKESENDNEEEKSLALRASKKKHSRSVISDRVSIAVIAARTYNKQCESCRPPGGKTRRRCCD